MDVRLARNRPVYRREDEDLSTGPPVGTRLPSLPAPCVRRMQSPHGRDCDPMCAGRQRDGGCLCDQVHAAVEHGIDWSFDLDRDGFWVYNGPPIPGLDLPGAKQPEGTLEVYTAAAMADEDDEEERRAAAMQVAGMVAVAADEAGRYTQFAVAMHGLAMPPGSKCIWQVGNDIAGNRNGAVEQMLEEGWPWLWFIDDDHAFGPDLLLSLLAHDFPVVAPLVLRRSQPFGTVAVTRDGEQAELAALPKEGLVQVDATGSSGMLIRREVFESIEPPWFQLGYESGSTVSEDMTFCRKAVEAGWPVVLDCGSRMAHITTCAVWPIWNEQERRWMHGFKIADGFDLVAEIQVVPVDED